jgi:hypothetical protein
MFPLFCFSYNQFAFNQSISFLDLVANCGSEGSGFESLRANQWFY